LRRSQQGGSCQGENPEAYDERVLGSGDFVEQVVRAAGIAESGRLSDAEKREIGESIIREISAANAVTMAELLSGSRRRPVSKTRAKLIPLLVGECGWNVTECARKLGVSASAVAKMISRAGKSD
jgi:hypothetical protein